MIGALVSILADDQQDAMSKLIDDAGPVAGLFVLLLGVFIYFLWRSMNKQLKRIDPSLTPGANADEQAFDRQLIQDALEKGEAATPEADESPRA